MRNLVGMIAMLWLVNPLDGNEIMSVTIYDLECPSCGETVYVNNGDEDDLTVPDIECVCCCYCQEIFPFNPKGSLDPDLAEDSFKTEKEALNPWE